MGKSQKNLFGLATVDLDELVTRSTADLELFRGKKLFLTGGTGFFGKWLLAAFHHANETLELGLDVTILSRDPEAFLRSHPEAVVSLFHFRTGDVGTFEEEEGHFDLVIHAATDTTAFTSEADEHQRSRAIVAGTERVLALAQRCDARLLNISSGAVYGVAAGQRTGASEEDYAAAEAITDYGRAKRQAEELGAESGVDFVTARAFAFLGPHLPLDAHFAAGNFLRDARRGGPILVRGDGTALRSYLYPADLVVWLWRILARGQGGQAYNVGSDEVVSTAELARVMAEAVEPHPEVVVQSLQPQGPQNIYLPDVTRARVELGLKVEIGLAAAISRTLEFLVPS